MENTELSGQIGNLKQSIINQYSKKKKDDSFIEMLDRNVNEFSPTIIYKEDDDENNLSSDEDAVSQPREVQVVMDDSSS